MKATDLYYDKMTKTPLAKLIISLGIPTTISMLITNIYNMVDTYFLSTVEKLSTTRLERQSLKVCCRER